MASRSSPPPTRLKAALHMKVCFPNCVVHLSVMLKSSVAQCYGCIDGSCVWIEGTVIGQLGPNSWVVDDCTGCISCTLTSAPLAEIFWTGCPSKPLSSCSGLIASLGALGGGNAADTAAVEIGAAVACLGVVITLVSPDASLHSKVLVFKTSPSTSLAHWLKDLRLGRGLL